MLQESAYDADDVYVLRLAGDARQDAAYTAHDHVYAHAGAGGLAQPLDYVHVGQRVYLEAHTPGGALGYLAVHQPQHLAL